jgi:hypothetical protein
LTLGESQTWSRLTFNIIPNVKHGLG